MKICREDPNLPKIWQKYRALYFVHTLPILWYLMGMQLISRPQRPPDLQNLVQYQVTFMLYCLCHSHRISST